MSLLPFLTAPLSLLWGAVVWVRSRLFDLRLLPSEQFGLPVICVGNLAVGGTGKTPHVEYLLRLLHGQGYRVAMLSRGYGRRTRGFRLVSRVSTASEVGDEPLQIFENCPFALVAVCEKRVNGIRELLRMPQPPEVIVLDDAYQHRYVRAGLNILLTDSARLYTDDHLLPWGRLREPASAATRADLIIVTKCRAPHYPSVPLCQHQTLYHSEIVYGDNYNLLEGRESASLGYQGRKVLLVAGIANPAPLLGHLKSAGAAGVEVIQYPDHHHFTEADAARMQDKWQSLSEQEPAGEAPAPLIVTTEKDAVRFHEILTHLNHNFQKYLYVQPITIRVKDAHNQYHTFNQKITAYVSQNSRNSRVD